MGIRLKSLKELGKGRWRIASSVGGSAKTPATRRRGNGRDPQSELFELVSSKYEDAVANLVGAVPGRKYEIDIALPSLRLAIETDGWAYHGKYKSGFLRDREKDRALMLAGWRVLRFTAGEIFKKPDEVMRTVDQAVKMIRGL
jgi:very-short-patch-repair endonuclease